MEIGATLAPLLGPPVSATRSFGDWMATAEQVCATLERVGFRYAVLTHTYQYGGMQPLMTLARLAPVTGALRLATQVLLLPLLNAADAAYNVATLDHICQGRLDLGIGLAYHHRELEIAGLQRRERVAKFEESLALMRQFWTGETVDHDGHYYQIHGTQMALTPYQQPHPPIWIAAHSHGAARRAGRLGEGLIVGPQIDHQSAAGLVETFDQEWRQHHSAPPTRIGAWRGILIGADPQHALSRGEHSGLLTFSRYHEGGMAEQGAVGMRLKLGDDASEWAILGNYDDCREGLARCRDDIGLTHVTCQFYNLPEDLSARLAYLEGFGSEVIQKLAG